MKTFKCKNCGKEKDVSHRNTNTYCSIKCQQTYLREQKKIKFLNNEYVGKKLFYRTGEWTRQIVEDRYGNHCASCGITDHNGKPITLEVNHIDGRAYNNQIDNLELLCPNCHSQTKTYKNFNKNSDRTYRLTK